MTIASSEEIFATWFFQRMAALYPESVQLYSSTSAIVTGDMAVNCDVKGMDPASFDVPDGQGAMLVGNAVSLEQDMTMLECIEQLELELSEAHKELAEARDQVRPEKIESGKDGNKIAPSRRPKTSRKSPKPSKLEPYLDKLGVIPDKEIAKLAGVTVENVRVYRNRHDIPARWRGGQ